MLPIFNEYQHAVNMNNGHSDDRLQEDKRLYSFRDLVIYAKWLRWSLWASEPDGEEKDSKVYNGLVTFCDQLLSHFNLDLDYRMINEVIKKSKEFKLRSSNPSYITNKEWKQVLMLPDDLSRRTYFSLLVLCKFNRNNPVIAINQNEKEYSDTRFKISYLLSDIYKYGLVKFNRQVVNNNAKCVYNPIRTLMQFGLIDSYFVRGRCTIVLLDADVEVDSNDVYLTITNYENLDMYYRYAMHENGYKICAGCGNAFKDNRKNNGKYCNLCTDGIGGQYVYRHCIDCGKRIRVNIHNTKTVRCQDCQHRRVQFYDRQRKNSVQP